MGGVEPSQKVRLYDAPGHAKHLVRRLRLNHVAQVVGSLVWLSATGCTKNRPEAEIDSALLPEPRGKGSRAVGQRWIVGGASRGHRSCYRACRKWQYVAPSVPLAWLGPI